MHCNLIASLKTRIDRVVEHVSLYLHTVLYFPVVFPLAQGCKDLSRHRKISLTLHIERLHCFRAKKANLSGICSHVVPWRSPQPRTESRFQCYIGNERRFLLTRCRRARVIATKEANQPVVEMTASLHTIEPAFVFQEPHLTLGAVVNGQGTVRDVSRYLIITSY